MKKIYLLILSLFIFNQIFTADDQEKKLEIKFSETFAYLQGEYRKSGDRYDILMRREDTVQDLINKINDKYKPELDRAGTYFSRTVSKLQIVRYTGLYNFEDIRGLTPEQNVVEAGIWDLDRAHKVYVLAKFKKLTIYMLNGTKFEYEIDRDFRLIDLLPDLEQKISNKRLSIKLLYKGEEINIWNSAQYNGFWDDENLVLNCIVKA